MHSCSKEFLAKFSNPNMSSIPTFIPFSALLHVKIQTKFIMGNIKLK